jgi:hypothetical protein
MGAWGVGNFYNDDAMDWFVDLENANYAAGRVDCAPQLIRSRR